MHMHSIKAMGKIIIIVHSFHITTFFKEDKSSYPTPRLYISTQIGIEDDKKGYSIPQNPNKDLKEHII